MKHFLGGYYLVQGATLENMPLLPSPFWSLSDCLVSIYPGPGGLSWAKGDAGAQKEYRERLSLTEAEYEDLQEWVDARFDEEQIGWPNVFLSLDAAMQFEQKYLRDIANVKLISTALPEPYLDEYLSNETQDGCRGQPGLVIQLQKKLPVPEDGWLERGYEVLGCSYGGEFHSFACNYLQTEYRDKLGISLNENGLLASFEDAASAALYTNQDDVGAEPALWLPWLTAHRSSRHRRRRGMS